MSYPYRNDCWVPEITSVHFISIFVHFYLVVSTRKHKNHTKVLHNVQQGGGVPLKGTTQPPETSTANTKCYVMMGVMEVGWKVSTIVLVLFCALLIWLGGSIN